MTDKTTQNTQLKEDGTLLKFFYFLFPFFALIESVKNFRSPSAKNLFWFFCAFYGLVHIYMPDGVYEGGGADSVRYALTLEHMYNSNLTWSELKNTFYDGSNSGTDIYQPIVTFIVSRFTGNAHVLFCVFAIVFGFFYSRNIWLLIETCTGKIGFYLGVFIISFALLTPIWQINGVRMWTALQVFLYGLIPYMLNNDKKKLYWCYCSILFHFSFLFPALLLLLFLFVPYKRNIFMVVFIISFFVSQLDLEFVKSILYRLGLSAFENKFDLYTTDYVYDKVIAGQQAVSWHTKLAKNLGNYMYQVSIFISYIGLKHINGSDERKFLVNRLFCFAALFYTFANVASSIPSGGRFLVLAQMLTSILVIYILPVINTSSILTYYKITAIGLLYPIIFSIRVGTDYWGISLLISNPITCWFIDDNTPIIEFVKSIL